jgi:hypothetical protein
MVLSKALQTSTHHLTAVSRRLYFRSNSILSLKPAGVEESTVPLEHRGVPLEHQGLHSTLYGDGDDHGATEQGSGDLLLQDARMPMAQFLALSKGKKAAGVFAIAGHDGTIKFVSFSRSLHQSLAGKHTS